jgi:hypothetical protein
MRFAKGFIGSLVVSLLLGTGLLAVPAALAQSYNPPVPGQAGGYDPYQNNYPIQGKQFLSTGSWSFPASCLNSNSPVVTLTLASPGVVNVPNNCAAGQAIIFGTSSALPTGLTAGTLYYVIATGLSTTAFEVSTTVGGSASNFTGSQSGVQTATAVYTNATTSFTSAIVLPPIPPGLVVPGHCVLPYQSTNASGTIEFAASVSSTSALLQVLNEAHTGSGGATVADIYTTVNSTTATAVSSTVGGGTANTTYGDVLYFTLTTQSTQTTPTTVTFYAESSSSSYTQTLSPGAYCVVGY